MPHDTRDNLVDFVNAWAEKTELPVCRLLGWIGLGTSKFHDGKQRYGKVNEHNAWVPRDHWLTDDENARSSTSPTTMTHVKTSAYYPQSNGKLERFHRTIKGDCIAASCLRQAQPAGEPAPPPATTRPAIDFAAIKETVTMAQVLALLEFTPLSSRNNQQRGPCPLHGSGPRSRSFSANLQEQTFQCFKCHAHGNDLDLWAQATHQADIYAAVDLTLRLNQYTTAMISSQAVL